MKQVLSVADFAIILDLVNHRFYDMEYQATHGFHGDSIEDAETERRIKDLQSSPYYKSLKHLKESLENLNVEVETPEVKIEDN